MGLGLTNCSSCGPEEKHRVHDTTKAHKRWRAACGIWQRTVESDPAPARPLGLLLLFDSGGALDGSPPPPPPRSKDLPRRDSTSPSSQDVKAMCFSAEPVISLKFRVTLQASRDALERESMECAIVGAGALTALSLSPAMVCKTAA